jgi:hypothetical protein
MSISVICPSCQSSVHVDESLAGKDILCPSCNERVTVPSLTAGRPEARPAAPRDAIEEGEERAGRRERDAELPRWSDADEYALPPSRDPGRWGATLVGLALIFWSVLIMAVLAGITQVVGLAAGSNPQFMFGGGPGGGGGNPQQAAALGLGMMALGCGMIIVMIVGFVGMCMCCTVPSESGAKGRAITTVILVVVFIITLIIFGIALFFMAINQAQRMGGPGPGFPFGQNALIGLMVSAALGELLIVTLWLMFHKAIADYFQNTRLARASVWFVVAFLVFLVVSQLLQFLINPMLVPGALPTTATFVLVSAWGFVGMSGLSVFYLLIVRETRRSIREDAAAVSEGREGDYE